MSDALKTVENTDNIIIENQLLKQQNAELSAKLKWYEDQFRLNQQRLYGKSSEQHLHDGQISIFNEAEVEAQPDASEPTMDEIHYKRRKQKGKREADLKDLPIETIDYRLTEEEQVCDVCGGDLHEMSKQVRKEIKIIPPQVTVVEHVSYVYSCRDCEKNEINTPIITAPTPNPVIPKSIASPSSVAYIMDQKFTMGLPLYRQEQQMERLGIPLSRQTMANWMIYASENWLTPLYDRLHTLLLQRDIAQADETILQVLKEPGRSADTNSYMWLYRTGRDGPHIVLYDYQTTRASKHPEKFLATFKGYLNVDYSDKKVIPIFYEFSIKSYGLAA